MDMSTSNDQVKRVYLAKWVECLPMVQETGIKSQVKSYQRLKKWYLILSCLTLSSIMYISRLKWSNPGKGVAPSPTPQCSSNWKGSLQVALNYSHQLYLLIHVPSIFYIYNEKIKNLEATLFLADFFKVFDSIHREKMEQVLITYGFSPPKKLLLL